jgi:hypothetical protein
MDTRAIDKRVMGERGNQMEYIQNDQCVYNIQNNQNERDVHEEGSVGITWSPSGLLKSLDYFLLRFIQWCDLTYLRMCLYRYQARKRILGFLPEFIAAPISNLIMVVLHVLQNLCQLRFTRQRSVTKIRAMWSQ